MTEIKIKPTGQQEAETIVYYDSCRVNSSKTERAGSFSIILPFKKDDDISKYTIGTDVQINQDGHKFRGYVTNPPKKSNYLVKSVTLEGFDYTAKTQKIIVSESYSNIPVSTVVNSLFAKYVPWVTRNKIQGNTRNLTIRFADTYLWDAMEQICNLTGYDWCIDENLDLNFSKTANSINENVLTVDKYKRGTTTFTHSAEKLVNKLWVKGSKKLSLPYTQNITVSGTIPISLHYTPRVADDETITVTIGGIQKTLGIQNITQAGTKDFLVNSNEKLLVPDLCVSGSGTIVYRYEYPIKILLEDKVSQGQYGLYEDILDVETDNKFLAKETGANYLEKYSKPVINGSLEPFNGIYRVGELVKIEIPSLNINDYLLIKDVTYESINKIAMVNRKITLESTQMDIASILKNMNKRIAKIETALFGTSGDTLVEKYNVYYDAINVPKLEEKMNYNLHNYLVGGANMMVGNFVI
ncbi:MAG TPA: hypothetical protein DCP90_01965 [Clostridiales bacterium]|nr:MAG: hypothetical protein A2Y22_08695 [Clostridiales bacterium GWD2_32_59]HAN09359.1 hypothetical protein [Clostridiales bacterium]